MELDKVILISGARGGIDAATADLAEDEFDKVIVVNLKGMFWDCATCCR